MRNSNLILILSLVLCVASHAAVKPPADSTRGVVSGFVEDAVTKEPLIGATISVKAIKAGAYTNKSGYFSISNIPAGQQIIVVSYVGYVRKEVPVTVPKGGSAKLRIGLLSDTARGREVTVTAERDEDKRQISISRVNIPIEQLSQLRIGGEADVFRALQMLPGVLTSSQISSGLFIRGGSPDQNLVLLDGMTVYNPTHLFGFISAFNNDAIKDVDLIKGGFPAEFGGRMSAVLNITQKDGNRDHIEGLVGLGLISSRASLQGPIGNGSFFLGGRRTYLDLVLGVIPEDPEAPLPTFGFYDLNAKITQNLGEDDKVSLSGFLTRDQLGFSQTGLDFGVRIGNRATSLRWSHIYDPTVFSVVTLSASRYDNGFDGRNAGIAFEVANNIIDYTAKVELEWFTAENLTLKGGYEGSLFNFNYVQLFEQSAQNNTVIRDTTALRLTDNTQSLFAQANWNVTESLSLQGGLRGNYWTSSEQFLLDPRLAARLQLSEDVAVKAAWGIYHQYLRLASAPDFSFFDTWLPSDRSVPPGRADHYVLSVESSPLEGYDFNVDVYYKNLENINELRQGNRGRQVAVSDVFYVGRGYTYGAEVFLQKRAGRLTGWIGYALGYVFSQFDSVNLGRWFRPKFDRRHDLKITAMYQLSETWEFGASFMFQSGQSYTGATSALGGRMPGWDGGIVMVNPSQRWGLRLPNSHQLNVNVNYNTTLYGLPFRLFLDVYNVYSRRDIWFRLFQTEDGIPTVSDVRLLPILPSISAELRF
ncbi:MAG: TonB-dependent receptor [Candidatus Kapabacteria bacterium]|nr:TonB-dependent receptor [Candidatus Kapabacteria bacterium]